MRLRQWIERARKSERGIAILLVMASIFMISTVIVDFAFTTNVNYHLALNNSDRLQAYYLAESSLNFAKLLIKYDKDIQKKIESLNVSVNVEPLYRMFPMSSALLRAGVSGALSGDEGSDEEIPPPDAEEKPSEENGEDTSEFDDTNVKTGLSVLQGDEAKDFLSFPGDFELDVSEVENKIDLSVFYDLKNTAPDYDVRKHWLAELMKILPTRSYFEDRDDDLTPEGLVFRLADWVDPNDVTDEFEGMERGRENDAYKDLEYTPKNGKFTSLEEIGLIPGMSTSLLRYLSPYLTIYNSSHLFNPCFAEDEVVDALIVAYSEVNTCLSPLNFEDDADKIAELRTSFLSDCPKVDSMGKLLDEAFGLSLGEASESKGSTTTTGAEGEAAPVKACGAFDLQAILTKDRKVFDLTGRGVVGETTLEIKTVLNATDDNPDRWTFYYFRVN